MSRPTISTWTRVKALLKRLTPSKGAVVIISHDPSVLEMTADRLWLVEDGRVSNFEGDLDDYRERLLSKPQATKRETRTDDSERKEQRPRSGERRPNLAHLKKKIEQAAAAVTKLEAERIKLQTKLADPKLYSEPAKATEAQRAVSKVEKDLAAAEEAWIKLETELEAAEA
jgi:ATP-binding cassette subfamily F protein 3